MPESKVSYVSEVLDGELADKILPWKIYNVSAKNLICTEFSFGNVKIDFLQGVNFQMHNIDLYHWTFSFEWLGL